MTSFVNMFSNDVWSEADIVRRTEAIIHGQFSPEQETILNRKATGAALGQYALTPDEQAELARYAQVSEAARLEGNAARADMALLLQVFEVEAAERRLAQPVVEPELDEDGNVTNQDVIDADEADRTAAQAAVDAASPEVMQWVEARRPPLPEPVPGPELQPVEE